jgi:hypothetical protein
MNNKNKQTKTLMLGWIRLALRGTVDSEARVPCHSLALQTCDGNSLKGPVLKLSEGSRRML